MTEESRADGWTVSFLAEGRAGRFLYRKAGRTMDIPWELSGTAEYDLLLAPMRLSRWTRPADAPPLSIPEQLAVLRNLRTWLATQPYRTDLSRPIADSRDRCRVHECRERSLEGSMLCGHHFDLNLLGQLFPASPPED